MANLIAVVGQSGFGKSTSLFPNESIGIQGLDPKETVLVNVSSKPLPFKGARKVYNSEVSIRDGGNYIETNDPNVISEIIKFVSEKRPEVKNVVVDDAGFIMGFEVMRRSNEKGFDKWTEIGANMFKPLNVSRTMRSDLNIIFTFHQEKGEDGNLKIKTAGKLLDNTIFIDGLFTFILYAVTINDFQSNGVEYKFQTNSNGTSTCKSPAGCFDEMYIPNDMGYVIQKIQEYYE